MNNAQRVWQSLVTNNVDKVTFLPCNKLNALMQQVPDSIDVWNITRESVGLGLCFGRSLAGKRSAMMIQNTGLGNLVTELYTMQKLYQSALPIFVSWRGYYQEPIEAQIIFGSKVEDLLNAIDVEYAILKSEADLADIDTDIAHCFGIAPGGHSLAAHGRPHNQRYPQGLQVLAHRRGRRTTDIPCIGAKNQ